MRQIIGRFIGPVGMEEWRASWPAAIGAMVGLMVAHVHLYSLGVMIAPLEHEFGWARTQISSGLLIIALVLFFLAPVLGLAIDRFGPRRIVLAGVVIYCLAVASLSFASAAPWTWWLLWALVAAGCLFLNPTVWVALISRRFSSSRGLALSVVLSGTGITSFAAPMVTYLLVSHFGWRQAYLFWGGGAAVVVLPILLLCFPRSIEQTGPAARHVRLATPGYGLSECIRVPAFRKLLMAGPIMALVFTAVIVNIVPILKLGGFDVSSAVALAGAIGLAQSAGRLLTGYFLDRHNPRHVGAIIVLFPALASVLISSFATSVPVALLAVILFGLAAGAEFDVLGYLASRYFGMRSFGAAFGIIVGLAALGTGIGPMLASAAYDLTRSYSAVLAAIIPLCLLSSWLFFSLGPFPEFLPPREQHE